MARPSSRSRHDADLRRRREVDDVIAEIAPIARRIVELQRQARALGVFPNDRELLICPTCALTEDVLADGRLVTFRELGDPDTGLRFVERTSDDEPFICPACGGEARSDHADDADVAGH